MAHMVRDGNAEQDATSVAGKEENADGDRTSGTGKPSRGKPRLTVHADVMERLRHIAEEREMSASELADELLSRYLDGIPEEEFESNALKDNTESDLGNPAMDGMDGSKGT